MDICARRVAVGLVAIGMAASSLLAPTTADASPWLPDDGELTIGLTYDFQHADREFLPSGTDQAFPLNGTFSGSQLTLQSGYGITEKFEVAGSIAFKHVSYEADPIILNLPDGADSSEATGSILDFSESDLGASDIRLTGRYQLANLDDILLVATDTELKLPTGYDKPRPTFEDGQPSATNIRDDVTLGDGQADITQTLQAGAFVPPTGTFSQLDAGFAFRFGDPGHQLLGGLKLGQFIGDSVMVFGQVGGRLTVTDGNVIGETFVAVDPTLANTEFSGDNVEPTELAVDRDYLEVGGGVVFQLEAFELQAAFTQIAVGENIPKLQKASLSILYRAQDVFGGGAEEE